MQMDFDEVFGKDYLYFYEQRVPPATSDADAECLWGALHLARGRTVIDLGSGDGRLSRRLASRGAQVTGVDASASMIAEASSHSLMTDGTLKYIHANAGALNLDGRFDAAFSWFTSFGFNSESEDRSILANLARHLHPGGLFAIDVANRDFIVRNLAHTIVLERNDSFLVDYLNYNSSTSTISTRRAIIRNGVRRISFDVRLFGYTDLKEWLIEAGFRDVWPMNEREDLFPSRVRLVARR
jgi:SAM-dependent methyltransferase